MTPKRLAKWLRDSADEIDAGGPFYSKSVPLRNAAAVLEAQASEIAELREALKPFAEEAKCWSERMPKLALVVDSFDDEEWNNPSFHVSDLLRARAKLEGSGA